MMIRRLAGPLLALVARARARRSRVPQRGARGPPVATPTSRSSTSACRPAASWRSPTSSSWPTARSSTATTASSCTFSTPTASCMWGDDHEPPVPTSSWKPGQTIEYTRTVFAPVLPYVGETHHGGRALRHRDRAQQRLTLAGEHVGQHAYKVARLDLRRRPRTCSPCSRTAGTRPRRPKRRLRRVAVDEAGWRRWRSGTRGKDALLLPGPRQPGSPSRVPAGQGHARRTGGRRVHVTPKNAPAQEDHAAGGEHGDRRDGRTPHRRRQDLRAGADGQGQGRANLGVRVFHAFVDPR